MNRKCLFFLLAAVLPIALHSQAILDRRIDEVFNHVALEAALYRLIDKYEAPLVFSNDALPSKDIYVSFRSTPLREVLQYLLQDTGLEFAWVQDRILIRRNAPKPAPVMRTISGYLEDAATGERLVSGTVWIPALQTGTVSNDFGFFSLPVPPGILTLEAAFIGYQHQVLPFEVRKDTFVQIRLERSLVLDEVLVTDLDSSLFSKDHGAIYLNPLQNAYLPQLGGTSDLLRTVHLLPGVQTGADGVGGFFVRGGNAGHNLVLIDGAPVYNYQHAGGIWSVFNPETVKSAKFLRSEFPARYGGRLSSVLDVRNRDGNDQALQASADIGLSVFSAHAEGPLVKGKSAFLVAYRRSLLNWFLRPYSRDYKASNGETGESQYQFYDLNAKLRWTLSERDQLAASFYSGRDVFDNTGTRTDTFNFREAGRQYSFNLFQGYREELDWRNTAQSLRWTRVLHPRLFMHTLATFSRLRVHAGISTRDTLFFFQPQAAVIANWRLGEYLSQIQDLGFRTDLEWSVEKGGTLRAGLSVNRHLFQPGVLAFDDEDEAASGTAIALDFRDFRAWSASAFAERERPFGRDWRLDYGMHLSSWQVDGKTFGALEPRLALYRQMSARSQLRFSLTRMVQYQHLLSGADVGLPTDLWAPATAKAPPASVWQASAGMDIGLGPRISASLDSYYKAFSRLAAYSEGVSFLDDWERNITVGEGAAYGWDLLLTKSGERLSAWTSYSLSWAWRQFPLINQGEAFPFKFDRRHDLKLAVLYNAGKRIVFSGTWGYATGLAVSLPVDAFTVTFNGVPGGPVTVIDFGPKNSSRLPAHHRLDLGMSIRLDPLWGLQQSLRLGVYNVYNRRNPLYFKIKSDLAIENGRLVERKSLVGVQLLPVLPSLSYALRW